MILEEFNDSWNYTFVIVMTIAILIGTFITYRKTIKEEKKQSEASRKEKRKESSEIE